jgi:DinB family protein
MLTTPTLTPELAELDRQFAALKAEASELLDGLKESQFNWRPDPHSWSMAECLLHLNMVGDRYVHLLEKALVEARAHGLVGHGPFTHGWPGKWILANTEPPPKRKSKAPRSFTPAYGQPITAVLPTFLHLQGQFALQLEQANGLDLARVKVPVPGWGPLKLNLYVTLAGIAAHERRHLWQARQVRGHAGFPAR